MNQCAEVVESNLPTSKRCKKCNDIRPTSNFCKSQQHKDGLYPWCSSCRSTYRKQPAVLAADNERSKAWQRANPQKRLELGRRCIPRWRAANPEASAVINRCAKEARRARMANVENTLTAQQWQDILTEFNHACAYCLTQDAPLEQDHMKPISKGGPHTAENIIPACRSCNARKANRSLLDFVVYQSQAALAA